MSDFDKIFADKLNEEGQFQQRDKNWRALSKRLDAFDSGVGGRARYLRYWQAAAAITFIGASVLFGNVWSIRQENADLRRQVAELQEKSNAARTPLPSGQAPLAVYPDAALQLEQTNQGSATSPPSSPAYQGKKPAEQQLSLHQNVRRFAVPEPINTHPGQTRPTDKLGKTAPEESSISTQEETQQPIDQKSTPEIASTNQQQPIHPEQQVLPEHTHLQRNPTVPLDLLPAELGRVESASALKRELPSPATEFAQQEAIIKPAPQHPSRFRAGIQATVGMPTNKTQGISAITGPGLIADVGIWRGIRLNASADWLRSEIVTEQYPDHFHLPMVPNIDPGPPMHHDNKLIKIEGSQRSQQISMGLAYTIPVRFPLRPAVRFAHTWVHLPSALYGFEIEEEDKPGGPPKHEYFPKRTKAEWLSNNWRLGVGLEYELPRWTLGAWADYSKNLTTKDPLFDALYIRAGVQYRFD